MFYKYRSDWNQGNTVIYYTYSLIKLFLFVFMELITLGRSKDYCSKITSLEGTANHIKVSNIIMSLGFKSESIGYKFTSHNNSINFLTAYLSGMKSLPFTFYYCFIRRGRYRKIVAKKLDFFILSNSNKAISVPFNSFKGDKYLFHYSELSPYQHLALDQYLSLGYICVFIPHATLPEKYPGFRSKYILQEGVRFGDVPIDIDGLYTLINIGSFNQDYLPHPHSILIGLNCFDSILSVKKIIDYISARNRNVVVTIRFHPATKFIYLRYVTIMILTFKYLQLDNGYLGYSLQKNNICIAGMSGILIDAVKMGRVVFTWMDPLRAAEFFNVDPEIINPIGCFPKYKSITHSYNHDFQKIKNDLKKALFFICK